MSTLNDTAAHDLAQYFQTGYLPTHGPATSVAAFVLASMAPTAPTGAPVDAEDDDAMYWPTGKGRALTARWRAEKALYGREVSA